MAAHARAKSAIVHIHSEQQAIDAIEADADGLAHLFAYGGESVDPKFAPLVAAHLSARVWVPSWEKSRSCWLPRSARDFSR